MPAGEAAEQIASQQRSNPVAMPGASRPPGCTRSFTRREAFSRSQVAFRYESQ
jgi:hypothetical protein